MKKLMPAKLAVARRRRSPPRARAVPRRLRRQRPAPRAGADQPPRRGVAPARRPHLRELLPQLPQREVHALQPPDGHRPHRGADPRQPDVRHRQDRRHHGGAMPPHGTARHGSARRRPTSRWRRACAAREWLYNYFLAFYRDDGAPSGWNNLVFPNVAMPHVFWALAGREPAAGAVVRGSRQGAGSRARGAPARDGRARQGTHDGGSHPRQRNAGNDEARRVPRDGGGPRELPRLHERAGQEQAHQRRDRRGRCSSPCCSCSRTG